MPLQRPISLAAVGVIPNLHKLSGVITFTGANGTTAVATLVPGPTPQATLTVNGVPVTAVPACVR